MRETVPHVRLVPGTQTVIGQGAHGTEGSAPVHAIANGNRALSVEWISSTIEICDIRLERPDTAFLPDLGGELLRLPDNRKRSGIALILSFYLPNRGVEALDQISGNWVPVDPPEQREVSCIITSNKFSGRAYINIRAWIGGLQMAIKFNQCI